MLRHMHDGLVCMRWHASNFRCVGAESIRRVDLREVRAHTCFRHAFLNAFVHAFLHTAMCASMSAFCTLSCMFDCTLLARFRWSFCPFSGALSVRCHARCHAFFLAGMRAAIHAFMGTFMHAFMHTFMYAFMHSLRLSHGSPGVGSDCQNLPSRVY